MNTSEHFVIFSIILALGSYFEFVPNVIQALTQIILCSQKGVAIQTPFSYYTNPSLKPKCKNLNNVQYKG